MSEGTELWRECVRWLVETGVLEKNHFSTIVEFASILRDGVLLCRLVNILVPNCIAMEGKIPFQPQSQLSQFVCQKTICVFLAKCQEHFGMKPAELFEAWNLFSLKDFTTVLATLSRLSHSEQALRLGFKPFPASCTSTGLHFEPEEEDIYKSLEKKVDSVQTDSAIYGYGSFSNLAEEEPHKIYDTIVGVGRKNSQRKDDAWSKFVPSNQKEHVIKEILDTEQNYVEKALNMIIKQFFTPLQSFIQETDHKIIFMNITVIWNLHQKFFNDLRQAVFKYLGLNQTTDGRPSSLGRTIGDVFLQHKDGFVAYGLYCTGLVASRDKIMHLEKSDSAVRSKISECTEGVNDNMFKLQDLLCLPMQRLLKYQLLLTQLIKETTVDAIERRSLEEAKQAMEDVNLYVNEMKRDSEAKTLIMEIQKSIADLAMPEGYTLLDYGRLHHDMEVKLSESTGQPGRESRGREKMRYVFLFDKVLIICKTNRNNSYTYKGAYILTELHASESEQTNGTITRRSTLVLTREERASTTTKDGKDQEPIRMITLQFKNVQQKANWLQHFVAAKLNVQPPIKDTGHKVHYRSFDITTPPPIKCSVCTKLLKGLFYQGYKCDLCNGSMHRGCIEMQKCIKRRATGTPSGISQSPSFTSLNGRRKSNIESPLVRGEHVVAIGRLSPTDQTFLPLERDDLIEVLESRGDSVFLGRLQTNSQRTGLVNTSSVKKLRAGSVMGLGSMSLDSPSSGNVRIDRKESTVLPRRPPMITPTPTQDYVNVDIQRQSWYMPNLDRQDAERKLQQTPNGTFLVRYSTNKNKYALSISYENEVKHTVVEQGPDGNFFLDEGYVFHSIVELINYYREHNLRESFNALNTSLKSPYLDCRRYRAIHDYSNESGDPKFLTIRTGDIITFVDEIGKEKGWWKGAINNRVGFFPMTYVEPYESDFYDR